MKFIIVLLLCTAVYGRINDSPFFGEPSNELTSLISGKMEKSNFDENPGGVDADPSLKRIFGLFPFSPFTLGSAISPLSLLNIASNIGPLGLYRQRQRTSSDWIGLLNTGLQQATGLKKLLLDAARTSGPIESNISDEPVDRQVSYGDLRTAVTENPEWNNLVTQLYEILLKAWNLWNSEKRSGTAWYSPQREVSEGRRSFADIFNIIKDTSELWSKWAELGEKAYDLGVETIDVWKGEDSGRRTEASGRRRFWDILTKIPLPLEPIVIIDNVLTYFKDKGSQRRSMMTPAWTLPVANILAAVFLKVATLLNSFKERGISQLLNQTSQNSGLLKLLSNPSI